jgi:hypothetical protein
VTASSFRLAMPRRREAGLSIRAVTNFFFLGTVFCCTFEKVHWQVAGAVSLADLLALGFIGSFLLLTRPRVPQTTVTLLCFFAAFLLVYLMGFFNLDTSDALAQFAKGLIKFVIHFSFLATGVAWLWRRGQDYYWRALAWFLGGMTVNAVYGVVQLLAARSGINLDSWLLSPITRGASQINLYGAVEGAKIYRANALTGDPNHLAIMLLIPLLVLTPLFLRLERDHPLKNRIAVVIGFLFFVELSTLSRSGFLGLAVGVLVLLAPYGHHLRSRVMLIPIGTALGVIAFLVITRFHYFEVLIRSRFKTSGGSESAHFQVYSFIPDILHRHPLFGLGLNNFSIYYEFVTGKSNWGPHSFYVSLLVETGLVGTALFVAFLIWVFGRLRIARDLGRTLTLRGDALAPRVRPLAWGMTAALAATLAANAFYLTMQFYYFFAFLAFALAVTPVFGRQGDTADPRRT